MVKVLAMRKMPTKSATAAKASRAVFMPCMLSSITLASASASSLPVEVVALSLGSALPIACWSAAWDVPAAASTSISVYPPDSPNSFCAVRVSNRASEPPAATRPSSVVKMPVSFCCRTGPSADIRTVSPTW